MIIGAGTGGYVAGIRAGQLGLRTAVIERDKAGGLCLNRGCIPTKALLESALLVAALGRAADHGITTGAVAFDYAVMQARKDKIVAQLNRGVEGLLKKYKADLPARQRRGAGRPHGAVHPARRATPQTPDHHHIWCLLPAPTRSRWTATRLTASASSTPINCWPAPPCRSRS